MNKRKTEDFMNLFNQFMQNTGFETKQHITQLYVEGRIDKEEYIRRMKNAK